MGFAEDLRQRCPTHWQGAVAHPFIDKLADGSLPEATFAFYLQQDSWFLQQEGGCLGQAIAKAPDLAAAGALGQLIDQVSQAERNRHRYFAEQLGRPLVFDESFEPAPTALAYVNHLQATAALGDFGQAMAALLPCPWIYRHFGKRLADVEPPHAIYRDWLSAYKQAFLDERLDAQIALLDRWAEGASVAQRIAAERAFQRSARYEVLFFNMALKHESWESYLGAAAS